ncbi:HCNGP domain-containing protein [Aspergillus lucknowensis]|uniref:HCNGP-like protein-domain-containing protein n=1 Tax=Aspergillus lucknowensis TaxID=176173 RepID=A0ABR4LKB1_9EURO
MLGLGAYGSSSEDEVEQKPLPQTRQEPKAPLVEASQTQEDRAQQTFEGQSTAQERTLDRQPRGPASGPVLGPMHQEIATSHPIPLSTSRTLIHDLTLPLVPNLDIPPSPPGSPDPSANAKFAHFLSLKKEDVHFNEKLAGSASLKNPSLLRKMMEHSGIDEQAQYSSSLPPDLWDISILPDWGYKEELLKTQKELNSKAEEKMLKGQRGAIEFVTPRSGSHPRSKAR